MGIVATFSNEEYICIKRIGDRESYSQLQKIFNRAFSCVEVFASDIDLETILGWTKGSQNLSDDKCTSMHFVGDWAKMVARNILFIFQEGRYDEHHSRESDSDLLYRSLPIHYELSEGDLVIINDTGELGALARPGSIHEIKVDDDLSTTLNKYIEIDNHRIWLHEFMTDDECVKGIARIKE